MEPAIPRSVPGIERYLAKIPSIGEALAKRLVAHFSEDIFDVIESEPYSLMAVPGVGRARVGKISSAILDDKETREALIFLYDIGLSSALAQKVFKAYGSDCEMLLRTDPYCLHRDFHGVGFVTADKIAMRLGVSYIARDRVKAGLDYVLSKLARTGHSAFPVCGLTDAAVELLSVGPEHIGLALKDMITEGRIVQFESNLGVVCASRSLHKDERAIASRMLFLAAQPGISEAKVRAALASADLDLGFDLAPSQRLAVVQALSSRIAIITGGPGVGKTTIVKAIAGLLRGWGICPVLAAPTGRAASRLAEVTGFPAQTIYRLLEYKGTGFTRNEEKPIEAKYVILDEVSMVDIPLMAALLAALPSEVSLLLVGDVDQLPSVGPGQVLSDLIASRKIPVVRLTEIFRQARESRIVVNAHNIIRGRAVDLTAVPKSANSDFYFIEAKDAKAAADLIVKLTLEHIPRRFGLHPARDVQVLSPIYKSEVGVDKLNFVLREAVNPPKLPTKTSSIYRVGDKVMQSVNNYEKWVFNGELGFVTSVEGAKLRVDFSGREVEYPAGFVSELRLAYATTIHKSQGSEFPAVIIPVVSNHAFFLQRRLLYTALTRAKKLAIFVGQRRALARAVANNEVSRRVTCLASFLDNWEETGAGLAAARVA